MFKSDFPVHNVITIIFQYRDSVLNAAEVQNLTQSLGTGENDAKSSDD